MTSSAMQREPVLLVKLRTALSHLYSLHNISNSANQHEAHNYLIEFQSRNIRRKAVSLYQRQRDSKGNQTQNNETMLLPDAENSGSSFYASFPFLLFTTPSHETERLFCAQTMLHRLRRMKVSESIDWDCEFIQDGNGAMGINGIMHHHVTVAGSGDFSSSQHYFMEFVKFHGEQISSFHVNLLGRVLQKYYQKFSESGTSGGMMGLSTVDLEERIKGEMTLLILATIAYLNVYAHTLHTTASKGEIGHDVSNIGPILNTLASSMALVAMRIRYTPSSIATNIPAIDTTIVSQVVQSFQLVSELACGQYHDALLPGFIQDESVIQFLHDQNGTIHQKTLSQCVSVSLASVPDALLGNPGGARGRLSIDPKCIMATNEELRDEKTGVGLLKEAVFHLMEMSLATSNAESTLYMQEQILIACERWARFVSLPLDFVQQIIATTLPNITGGGDMNSFDKSFFAFLVRIYEGACTTVDQLIATAAGLSTEQNSAANQSGKRKQSSKSKKRQKERLQAVINGNGQQNELHVQVNPKVQEAEKELYTRGLIACHTAMWTWDRVNPIFAKTLELMSTSPHIIVEGEGPVGCICTCVSACLPHIIRHGQITEDTQQSVVLIELILEALKNICTNGNSSVRALSYEHIAMLHKVLVQQTSETHANLNDVETMITRSICECCIILSTKCAYPEGYFNDLAMSNDEDLEIERNDIRDLIRVVCSLEGNKNMSPVPLSNLECILQYCAKGVSMSNSILPPEAVVHVLSSPAKALSQLTKTLQNQNDSNRAIAERIIHAAFDCLGLTCAKLLQAFAKSLPLMDTLPVSRLVCLALASFASTFNSMMKSLHNLSNDLSLKLQKTIGLGVLSIAASIKNIPELIAESSLNSTRFDIRGAMRGPGGEDHCGCIALIRMIREGEHMSLACLSHAAASSETDITSMFTELGQIYLYLHKAEIERPPGQMHGDGVTPKSRRTFLAALTSIGLSTMKAHPDTSANILCDLKGFFQKPIDVIISCGQRTDMSDSQKLFVLCGACFDLSSFPPTFCKELFESQSRVVEILLEACISGYKHPPCDEPSESILQWGRLRAAILSLLRSSADPGFTRLGVEAIKALNNSECDAILSSLQDKHSSSAIFNEMVVSEDIIAAGAFIVVIKDIMDGVRFQLKNSTIDGHQANAAVASSVAILSGCKDSVYSLLRYQSMTSKSGYWEDPLPTLAEAWFLAVSAVIKTCIEINVSDVPMFKDLVCETLACCAQILLSKRVEKESGEDTSYLSLDGPQTLAMVEFLETAFRLGPHIFTEVAQLFHINGIELDTLSGEYNDASLVGGGIMITAIYRGSSGAVPPWAVEYLPDILKSIYNSCGGDFLVTILNAGADLQLSGSCSFGCVQPNRKLAGRYFDILKPKGREEFTIKSRSICNDHDGGKWRKLKVLVKAVCGGKKNNSGFSLKPAFTNWECDRV